jgi:hypothetical protein
MTTDIKYPAIGGDVGDDEDDEDEHSDEYSSGDYGDERTRTAADAHGATRRARARSTRTRARARSRARSRRVPRRRERGDATRFAPARARDTRRTRSEYEDDEDEHSSGLPGPELIATNPAAHAHAGSDTQEKAADVPSEASTACAAFGASKPLTTVVAGHATQQWASEASTAVQEAGGATEQSLEVSTGCASEGSTVVLGTKHPESTSVQTGGAIEY